MNNEWSMKLLYTPKFVSKMHSKFLFILYILKNSFQSLTLGIKIYHSKLKIYTIFQYNIYFVSLITHSTSFSPYLCYIYITLNLVN